MINGFKVLTGAVLLVLISSASSSRADTISFADAVSTLASDCGSDIKKFCKGLNLGNGRIQDCLEAHAAKVSPTCTATLVGVTDSALPPSSRSRRSASITSLSTAAT